METSNRLWQQVATIANRPMRLGFIINRGVDSETLDRVFQYNTSIWGGELNLFVPTDGNELSNDWWRILQAHDPDIIIWVGNITDQLRERIYVWILPFYHASWDNKLLEECSRGQDRHSMSVWPLLRNHHRQKGKLNPGNSNYYFPFIAETKYTQFFKVAFGVYPHPDTPSEVSFENAFKELLGAQHMPCIPTTLEQYLVILDDFNNKITPLHFTAQLISMTYHGFFHTPPTLIITDGLIDDVFLYHAFHWESPFAPISLVHVDDLADEENVKRISTWIGSKIRGNKLTLASFSVGIDKLRVFREQIRAFLPSRNGMFGQTGWYISIDAGNFEWTTGLEAVNNKKQQLINIDEQSLAIFPELSFDGVLDAIGTWVTEIELIPRAGRKDGFRPSMFPTLNAVLSGARRDSHFIDATWQRIARGLTAKRVNRTGQIHGVFLPQTEVLIDEIIGQTGSDISRSTLGQYCHGIVDVMGGLENVIFVKDEYMRKLFYELSDERFNRESTVDSVPDHEVSDEKAVEDNPDAEATSRPKSQKIKRIKAHTIGQMLQLIKAPGDYSTKFKEQVAALAEKGIFIRGSNLTCTRCGLTTWYRIDELAETIKCKGCYRGFQMPVEKKVEFAYQLNPLFFEGFSQGVSCVVLTALLLEELCDHSMMWQSGCMIKKDAKNTEAEYDLVAMCDGLLVVAECKTFFDNATVKDKVLPQLLRDIDFAERIHADIFLFATQKEDVATEIVDFLREQNANRTRLHVRLVSSTELYEGVLLGEDETPREKITSLFQLVKRFPPYIPGLSEIDPKGVGGTMAY